MTPCKHLNPYHAVSPAMKPTDCPSNDHSSRSGTESISTQALSELIARLPLEIVLHITTFLPRPQYNVILLHAPTRPSTAPACTSAGPSHTSTPSIGSPFDRVSSPSIGRISGRASTSPDGGKYHRHQQSWHEQNQCLASDKQERRVYRRFENELDALKDIYRLNSYVQNSGQCICMIPGWIYL